MSSSELLEAASAGGARSLGLDSEAGQDRTYLRVDGALGLSGWPAAEGDALVARLLFGASGADVDEVVVAGRTIVEGGEHVSLGPKSAVAARLSAVVRGLLAK